MTDNPGWQPRHDDPLFILAMDHRASFGKTLFGVKDDHPDPDQVAAMTSAKLMIFDGLRAALPSLSYGRAGVLVDERRGQEVVDDKEGEGVEPRLWKVEGLETAEAAQQVVDQARAGRRDADLIVLGRDAPTERLDHWLEVASEVSAFVGFAIGRSIWEDAVRDFEASDHGEAAASAARAQVAERYLGFVAHWTR